jgi:pyrroloquinoline quinone biosynthesis protein D
VLARHVRLAWDGARERHVLLGPESVVLLNGTGAAILGLCDGQRTVTGIVEALGRSYVHVSAEQVVDYLARLTEGRCVEVHHG